MLFHRTKNLKYKSVLTSDHTLFITKPYSFPNTRGVNFRFFGLQPGELYRHTGRFARHLTKNCINAYAHALKIVAIKDVKKSAVYISSSDRFVVSCNLRSSEMKALYKCKGCLTKHPGWDLATM